MGTLPNATNRVCIFDEGDKIKHLASSAVIANTNKGIFSIYMLNGLCMNKYIFLLFAKNANSHINKL